MSVIYSAKYMTEANTSLADQVLRKPVNETYLFSAIELLREMNSIINDKTKELYIQIAEAESKEDENKLFANYFYQFKTIWQGFADKLEQMKSRMVMSVENKVETWEDLVKDDSYITTFNKEFSYSGYEFCHMTEHDYPRLNLYKIYQKEFDYLGQLMQDTGIGASPSAKLKVIASVSNNFTNNANNQQWILDLVKDMVDVDEKEYSRSYSEQVYHALRDEHEFTVNRELLYTCKEALADYEDAVDAAVRMCNNLVAELNKVSEEVTSYLFRNKDNKLKIKTDTDGIIDRDYRLDTYSMNQLDLFMKNKVTQMKKVLNVFSIAIGIKFDTVVDYIDQNIKILQIAKDSYTDGIPAENQPTQDTEDNADSVADTTPEEVPQTDEPAGEEPTDGTEEDPVDDEPSGEEPTDDTSSEPASDDDTVVNDDSDDLEDFEEFDEAYLFESTLFELEMMQESFDMYNSVRKSLLLEEETPNNDNNTDSNTSNLQNVQKIADQANTWQKIVTKLVELWKRFKEAVFERTKAKIEFLQKNGAYIASKVSGTISLKYTPDLANLRTIKIPDLNYETMKEDLVDAETFAKKYFSDYYEEGKSISESIKSKLLGEEQKDKKNTEITPSITEAYDFCLHYTEKIAPVKAQTSVIEKAQRVARDVTKVQESANNNDYRQYFNEFEDNTPPEQKEQAKKDTENKSSRVTVYFKVCSQVLAAEMTVYTKLFNELYAYCKWHIKMAGGKGEDGSSDTQTKSADASNGDAKFD